MDEIAQVLAAKNREAMGLWLLVLNRLGISNKEAAERFGVSPALVSYWATGQRRMTLEDEAMAYGLFADTFLEKWPKAGAKKREKYLPLVQRLVQTWDRSGRLKSGTSSPQGRSIWRSWHGPSVDTRWPGKRGNMRRRCWRTQSKQKGSQRGRGHVEKDSEAGYDRSACRATGKAPLMAHTGTLKELSSNVPTFTER